MDDPAAVLSSRVIPVYGSYEPGMKLADLHVHTTRSDGWWRPEALAEAAVAMGLSAIAVTDHDDCGAGFEIAGYCARNSLPLVVYPGAEISAREGASDSHVIGLDLQHDVRPWQSVGQTVEDICAQGGIPVLPHPRPDGIGRPSYSAILDLDAPVAIEVYNSGIEDLRWIGEKRGGIDVNAAALEFYLEHQHRFLGAVGGTDAHFRTLGRGLTAYYGDLLKALNERRTVVVRLPDRERLMPWDPVNYYRGLKRMARRRAERWGERPGGSEASTVPSGRADE
jgi:PHP domain-containing protein